MPVVTTKYGEIRTKRYSAEEIEGAVDAYMDEGSAHAASSVVGIRRQTILRWANRLNVSEPGYPTVETSYGKVRTRKYSPKQVQIALDVFKSRGASAAEKSTGIPHSTVTRHAKQVGLKEPPKRDEDEAYGHSKWVERLSELEEEHDSFAGTVNAVMAEWCFPGRTSRETHSARVRGVGSSKTPRR